MSREAKLAEALSVALKQWRMYSNGERLLEDEHGVEIGMDAEAELYRMCAVVLENARDKEAKG